MRILQSFHNIIDDLSTDIVASFQTLPESVVELRISPHDVIWVFYHGPDCLALGFVVANIGRIKDQFPFVEISTFLYLNIDLKSPKLIGTGPDLGQDRANLAISDQALDNNWQHSNNTDGKTSNLCHDS
ncbi:hypothetical protein FPRO03_06980 [Fusarium proliferatum]|nr:hypothetical protein FPRO03_06980 [Fusarium proliferatum]